MINCAQEASIASYGMEVCPAGSEVLMVHDCRHSIIVNFLFIFNLPLRSQKICAMNARSVLRNLNVSPSRLRGLFVRLNDLCLERHFNATSTNWLPWSISQTEKLLKNDHVTVWTRFLSSVVIAKSRFEVNMRNRKQCLEDLISRLAASWKISCWERCWRKDIWSVQLEWFIVIYIRASELSDLLCRWTKSSGSLAALVALSAWIIS